MKLDEISVICTTIFIVSLWIGAVALLTSNVETSFNIECDAEYIGLDYETDTIIQNRSCGYDNLTCFVQDTLNSNFNIHDLKGLNCKVSGSSNSPSWIFNKVLK